MNGIKVKRHILSTKQVLEKLERLIVTTAGMGDFSRLDGLFYVDCLKGVLNKNRWNPVTESLPDNPDKPYVQIVIDGVVQSFPARYNFGHSEWEWADTDYDSPPSDSVTHWRALPTDPPEGT